MTTSKCIGFHQIINQINHWPTIWYLERGCVQHLLFRNQVVVKKGSDLTWFISYLYFNMAAHNNYVWAAATQWQIAQRGWNIKRHSLISHDYNTPTNAICDQNNQKYSVRILECVWELAFEAKMSCFLARWASKTGVWWCQMTVFEVKYGRKSTICSPIVNSHTHSGWGLGR